MKMEGGFGFVPVLVTTDPAVADTVAEYSSEQIGLEVQKALEEFQDEALTKTLALVNVVRKTVLVNCAGCILRKDDSDCMYHMCKRTDFDVSFFDYALKVLGIGSMSDAGYTALLNQVKATYFSKHKANSFLVTLTRADTIVMDIDRTVMLMCMGCSSSVFEHSCTWALDNVLRYWLAPDQGPVEQLLVMSVINAYFCRHYFPSTGIVDYLREKVHGQGKSFDEVCSRLGLTGFPDFVFESLYNAIS